jgi:biopolymer transport protein ExbB
LFKLDGQFYLKKLVSIKEYKKSDMLSFFQESKEVLEGTLPNEKTLSIYKLIMNGGLGGQLILALLLVLLTIALYIYFERFFAIKSASKIDQNFMNQIKENVSEGKLVAADSLCKSKNTPTARLIGKGISRIGKPLEDINTAIETAGKLEVYQLEKNVSVLATIAGVAPMIGFLGTVIGMIVAIHEIANAGGQIDIKMLSDGLYTAMTTTVGGLIVGIIAYSTYNHLVVKTDKVVYQMEAKSVEFLDLLNEPV